MPLIGLEYYTLFCGRIYTVEEINNILTLLINLYIRTIHKPKNHANKNHLSDPYRSLLRRVILPGNH